MSLILYKNISHALPCGIILCVLYCRTQKIHAHIYERGKNGGAGVLKDEHPSEAPVSPSNAVSISSSGILSMLNGFLLALMMRVKWSSYR